MPRGERALSGKSRAGWIPGKGSLLLPPSLGVTLVLYAALVLAIGWAYSALRIRTDREETYQSQTTRLHAVAVALETGALGMLNDGVGGAVSVAEQLDSAAGLDATPARQLQAALADALKGGQYVHSVFVADGARFARAGRGGAFETGARLPGWFTAPITSDAAAVWIGKPIADPDWPGWTVIPVARAVPAEHGLRLWAGALFDFGAFGNLHTQLGGPGGLIGLLTSDGVLVAVTQDAGGPPLKAGTSYASSPLFRSVPLSSESGIVEGFAPSFGTRMVFAYGRVHDYPLTVITGLPLDAMLAPWHERTRTTLLVTVGSSALVLVMTMLLSHSLQALRRRELHYRTLFNNAAFSVFLLEGDNFTVANQTAVRMFGLPSQGAVRGMTPWMLSPVQQPDGRASDFAARERIAEALREGNATFEWLHRRLDSGEEFPAQVDLSSLRIGRTVLALAVVHDLSERKRAEQERRESEGRYRALVDALPEAVFVHRGGELLFGNAAARRLIGADPADPLAGRPVLSFAVDADREVLAQRTRQILEEGGATEPREARVRRLDGSLIWVELQGVRVEYGGAPAVQSLMRDISAHKRRQEADAARSERMQRQSAALLRLASRLDAWSGVGAALQGIASAAAQVLAADRVAVWLLEDEGLRCAALQERDAAQRTELRTVAVAQLPLYLAGLGTERVIEASEVRCDRRLSEFDAAVWPHRPARSMIAAAVRNAGELVGVVSVAQLGDIRNWQPDESSFAAGIADQVAQALLDSQRERVLADLRSLAGELMRIQDEERRRIGRELHDSTGQVLAALEMDLARLKDCARALDAPERALLEESLRLARQCSTEIRTASYLLHPPLLDELGLVSALRWLADGLRQRGGLEVRLELPQSTPRLRSEEELALFRVAQEALTNVQRHAGSAWAAVRLAVLPDSIALEIEDAGRGIAVRGAVFGVGLAGMRERIRQMGGSFAVESTAAGTCIRVAVPRQELSEVRRA